MKSEVIEKLAVLTTTAFGLVAALAWNDAIRSLFEEGGALAFVANGGPWVYAVFVTIIAVIMTIWIGRVASRVKGENTEKKKKQ